MASDTPGGRRPRRVDRTTIRSADEYYKSGDVSTVPDSVGKREAVEAARGKTPPRRVDRTTVRSADEYYANAKPATLKQLPTSPRRVPTGTGGLLEIKTLEDIEPALDMVVARLQSASDSLVTLGVEGSLAVRVRARIDSLVARGIISDEQKSYVRVLRGDWRAKLGSPEPRAGGSPPAPVTVDPAAFLAAGGDDHPVATVDTSAVPVNVVDEDEDSDLGHVPGQDFLTPPG